MPMSANADDEIFLCLRFQLVA